MKTKEEIRKKLDALVHSNIALVNYIKAKKENDTEMTRKTFYENCGMQYALEWVLGEKMKKYIIKNCPAKDFGYKTCSNSDKPCKDITDCLLKQIVEKCYKATHEDLVITDDYHKTASEVAEIYGRAGLAQEILQLLEIEEVDD